MDRKVTPLQLRGKLYCKCRPRTLCLEFCLRRSPTPLISCAWDGHAGFKQQRVRPTRSVIDVVLPASPPARDFRHVDVLT